MRTINKYIDDHNDILYIYIYLITYISHTTSYKKIELIIICVSMYYYYYYVVSLQLYIKYLKCVLCI